jgi:hypothetical protein
LYQIKRELSYDVVVHNLAEGEGSFSESRHTRCIRFWGGNHFMNVHRKLVTAAIAAGLFASTTAHAEEKRVRREDLPPAVEKTVAEQSKGASIKGFSKEVEHGKTYYEAELTGIGTIGTSLSRRTAISSNIEEDLL